MAQGGGDRKQRGNSENYPVQGNRTTAVIDLQPRDGTSKRDGEMINFYVQELRAGMDDPQESNKPQTLRRYVQKRPGLAQFSQPTGGAATARGIYHWHETDEIYSVWGQALYANTSNTGHTISIASGTVHFAETNPTDSAYRLFLADGKNIYALTSGHTLTVVNNASDADFPTSFTGHIVYFDTYLFIGDEAGQIYNSDELSGYTSWSALGFQSTEMFQDKLRAIMRQKDQVIVLGSEGIEFYYNDALSGSPLRRQERNATQVGLADPATLAVYGDTAAWVAAHQDGGFSVWQMDGLKRVKEIGNDFTDVVLKGEATIGSCKANMVLIGGGLYYVLNCPTYARSIVYDFRAERWYEWQSANSSHMSIQYVTHKDNVSYVQDPSNGRVYTFSPTTYQDNTSDFTCQITLPKVDHGSPYRKFSTTFEVMGDVVSGNLDVWASDDDGSTFTSYGQLDMSTTRKFLKALGSYYQRNWRVVYSSNTTLRIEGFGEQYKEGTK